MSVKNRITRGFKKLSGLDDTDFVTLEDFRLLFEQMMETIFEADL